MNHRTPPPGPLPAAGLRSLSPVPTLIQRVQAELSHAFVPGKPIRISRAPGRLDVMGGIANYTGALVCAMTLNRAAAVALQERNDRNVQIISLNLLDEALPFTIQIPLSALCEFSADALRKEFSQSGRKWAGYLAGCLFALHEAHLVSLSNPQTHGMNIALYSSVPLNAGVGSSSAIAMATMINLVHHFGLQNVVSPMQMAEMCAQVENRIVGAVGGVMDAVAGGLGETGRLFRMICQPHEVLPALELPEGIRVLGINSNVRHSVGDGLTIRTRCAAFMGHKMILERMRKMGQEQGRELIDDPMKGYLANLDQNDYKTHFRPHLPEYVKGQDFLDEYGATIDPLTRVEAKEYYPVQKSADHHVLEARRVRQFVQFLEQAQAATGPKRRDWLNKAGHLMYASHISYTNDALLGADECDRLVHLVRDREAAGLYGARITAGGSGGTVAVLADIGAKTDQALAAIMEAYARETGQQADSFLSSSPGAVHVGTALI